MRITFGSGVTRGVSRLRSGAVGWGIGLGLFRGGERLQSSILRFQSRDVLLHFRIPDGGQAK